MDRRVRSLAHDTRARLIHTRLDLAASAFFSALAIATFVATRRRPVYGLIALIAADPFDFARYIGPTTVTVPKIVLIAVILGSIGRGVSLGPLRSREIRPMLAGAIAIALVTIATFFPGTYVDAVAREALKALQYLVTFSVAVIGFARDPDETPLWYALGAVTLVVCAGAIAQEFSGAPAAAIVLGHVIPRVAGLLDGPNQLAGFLDIAVPLVLARALSRNGRPYFAIVAIAIVTDVLTFSRAGLLAIVIATLCVTVRIARPAMRSNVLAWGGAFFVAIALALVKLRLFSRFLSADDVDTASGLGSRKELWSAALRFFRDHPILGIGAGNFELELPDAGLEGVRTHANSLYLQSLAEGGVALFAATVFTVFAAIRTLYVKAPREALFVGAGGATIALAVHQCFDFLTFFPKVGSFWWLWLGIAGGALVSRTASGLEPRA